MDLSYLLEFIVILGPGPLGNCCLRAVGGSGYSASENRLKLFPIHSSFKFNPVIVEKGGTTEVIRTAFMRRNLDDWERAEEIATTYSLAQVKRFSPKSLALLEIQSEQEIRILEKIYRNGVLLGDKGPDGWGIKYKLEFMMNTDAHLFPPRPQWEAKGYRPDEYSRWLLGDWRPIEELWRELDVDPSRPDPVEIELDDWLFDTTAGPERREAEAQFVHGHLLKPGDVARTDWSVRCARLPYDRLPVPRVEIPPGFILSRDGTEWIWEGAGIEDVALPFYEGRMIGQFDFSEKGWVSGKGRRAVWREIPWERKQIEPQYLMGLDDYRTASKARRVPKTAYMRVSSTTNARTTISSYLGCHPAGDSVFFFVPATDSVVTAAVVSAIFSTFAFDWVLRQRLVGLNMSEFVMVEAPLPRRDLHLMRTMLGLIIDLCFGYPSLATERLVISKSPTVLPAALTPRRRLERIAMIDAISALAMGIGERELRHVLADCDMPLGAVESANPKGFWRVDSRRHPELRRTVLALVAYLDLQGKIKPTVTDRKNEFQSFLSQNHGEGWMLPETLRLADYGLGHDDRAQHPQPVASCLGPRFYDWQLVQSADESWQECHLHARNLLGASEYARVTSSARDVQPEDSLPLVAERHSDYTSSKHGQKFLFPLKQG